MPKQWWLLKISSTAWVLQFNDHHFLFILINPNVLISLDSDNLYVHVDSKFDTTIFPKSSDLNFRSNYLFNTGIAALEDADFLLIIGSNVRYEAPLVNHRIRKAWRQSTLIDIAFVGPKNLDLSYDYTWLGDDLNTLNQIYSETHPVVKKLKAAKKPVIILGQQILKSENSNDSIYSAVKSISEKFNADFNILHANASQVAAFDLGFKPSFEMNLEDNNRPTVMWLFGVDDAGLQIPKNCFVVYQVID